MRKKFAIITCNKCLQEGKKSVRADINVIFHRDMYAKCACSQHGSIDHLTMEIYNTYFLPRFGDYTRDEYIKAWFEGKALSL